MPFARSRLASLTRKCQSWGKSDRSSDVQREWVSPGAKYPAHIISFTPQSHEAGMVTILILQMQKLRFRKLRSFAQSYLALLLKPPLLSGRNDLFSLPFRVSFLREYGQEDPEAHH